MRACFPPYRRVSDDRIEETQNHGIRLLRVHWCIGPHDNLEANYWKVLLLQGNYTSGRTGGWMAAPAHSIFDFLYSFS